MQKTQTYCDSCGRAKGETNNWFVLWVSYKRKLFSLVCFVLLDSNDMHLTTETAIFIVKELRKHNFTVPANYFDETIKNSKAMQILRETFMIVYTDTECYMTSEAQQRYKEYAK